MEHDAPVPLAEQPTDEEIGRSIAGLIGVRLNYEAQGAPPEALKLIDLARKVCCDYARIKQSLQQRERAIAALRAAEAADETHSNCPECEGEIMPELCPVCFPAADDARVMRRNALAALDAASAAGDAV